MPAYHSAGAVSSRASAVVDPNLAILMNLPGLLAFFDPDWADGLSLRESGGTQYVTAMLDRTGQHVLAQATGANQPVWGALSPTGRRLATYNGTSSHLLTGSDLAGQIGGASSFTIYTHVQLAAVPSGGQRIWCIGSSVNGGGADRCDLIVNAQTRLQLSRAQSGESTTTNSGPTGTVDVGECNLFTVSYDGSAKVANAYKNDSENALGGISNATNERVVGTTSFCVGSSGSSNYFSGEIGPVIVCAGVHTAETRQAAAEAIISYYGIGEAA